MENQKVHQNKLSFQRMMPFKIRYIEFERSNQKMVNANPKLDMLLNQFLLFEKGFDFNKKIKPIF
jgi:hypothetical protein